MTEGLLLLTNDGALKRYASQLTRRCSSSRRLELAADTHDSTPFLQHPTFLTAPSRSKGAALHGPRPTAFT